MKIISYFRLRSSFELLEMFFEVKKSSATKTTLIVAQGYSTALLGNTFALFHRPRVQRGTLGQHFRTSSSPKGAGQNDVWMKETLHFIPASSVRRHRSLSSLEEAVEPEVFHSQPSARTEGNRTCSDCRGGQQGESLLLTFKQTIQNCF